MLSKGLFVINICTKEGYVMEACDVYNSLISLIMYSYLSFQRGTIVCVLLNFNNTTANTTITTSHYYYCYY